MRPLLGLLAAAVLSVAVTLGLQALFGFTGDWWNLTSFVIGCVLGFVCPGVAAAWDVKA